MDEIFRMDPFEALDMLPSAPDEFSEPSPRVPYEKFQYELYDWNRTYDPDVVAVRGTQGYFAFISRKNPHAEEILRVKWCSNVQRDKKTREVTGVYLVRRVNNKYVYLHRVLVDGIEGDTVDHANRWTLDCRDSNLRKTNRSGNNANLGRDHCRKNHIGLPRGVTKYKSGFRGRITKHRCVYISRRMFQSPWCAHVWYLVAHQKLHGIPYLTEREVSTKFPVFPPLCGTNQEDDIPF